MENIAYFLKDTSNPPNPSAPGSTHSLITISLMNNHPLPSLLLHIKCKLGQGRPSSPLTTEEDWVAKRLRNPISAVRYSKL
jgi:hypothetical protein